MQRFVQMALDLFGDAGAGPAPRSLPELPPPPVTARPVAPPAPPAAPMSEVFQPGVWHHPRANRMVRLGDAEVAYEFKRGKRRTIGLSIGADGLTVSAPRWTPVGEVEALLKAKAAWVMEKLQKSQARVAELARSRTVWADGAEFTYLGQSVRLQLDPSHAFAEVGAVFEAPADPSTDGWASLRLGLAHNASERQIRDAAQAWLMRQAQRVFNERLTFFGPQLGVRHERLRLSSAGTRWGSASADGTIRLNWRLIHLRMEMIDYVVVHELSHLRHMDHSPQFWDVVASVMPDHAQRRKALKLAAVPLDG